MSATLEQAVTTKGIVLYDGECPLCQRSVLYLKRLDWRERLEYRDVRQPENVPPQAAAIEPKQFLEQMHVVTPKGSVYAGFRAFRWIAGRLPILMPIWPFLFLPGVPWIGQRAYLWVAKNRFNLVPCHDGQCAIPRKK